MKLIEILTERVSDVVYRIVPGTTALRNLQTNSIQLTPVIYPTSKDASFQKGRFFYLSLARTPNNSFFKIRSDRNLVIFVMDGRKLSQNYKGVPVNYFDDPKSDINKFEAEDRIISNKAVITDMSKYVKEIHVNIDTDDSDIDLINRINDLSSKLHISTYLYVNDCDSFIKLNKRKSIDSKDFVKFGTNYSSKNTRNLGIEEKDISDTYLYSIINFYENKRKSSITSYSLVGDLMDIYYRYNQMQDDPGEEINFEEHVYEVMFELRQEYREYRKVPAYYELLKKLPRMIRRFDNNRMMDFITKLAIDYNEAN